MKENVLLQIDELRSAVETENIDSLVELIDKMEFDVNRSVIARYLKTLLVDFITAHIKQKNLEKLRIERHSEYGETTYDTYKMCDGVLFRNGSKVEWASVGKLYQAYKFITNRGKKL